MRQRQRQEVPDSQRPRRAGFSVSLSRAEDLGPYGAAFSSTLSHALVGLGREEEERLDWPRQRESPRRTSSIPPRERSMATNGSAAQITSF